MNLLGHVLKNVEWPSIILSVVGVIGILIAPVGWILSNIGKIGCRLTVLETKDEGNSQKLDRISKKVSDMADSVQIIKVAIAKIETTLKVKADESNVV